VSTITDINIYRCQKQTADIDEDPYYSVPAKVYNHSNEDNESSDGTVDIMPVMDGIVFFIGGYSARVTPQIAKELAHQMLEWANCFGESA
jgi:hypothetical protein